jgi:hypothetical protein
MTTLYRQRILNLLHLLQERPDLFADLQAERQALSHDLPDDIVAAANAVSRWCKTHPDIYRQLLTLPNTDECSISDTSQGRKSTEKDESSNRDERSISGNPPQYPNTDQGLLNELRVRLESKPVSPSQPPKSSSSDTNPADASNPAT